MQNLELQVLWLNDALGLAINQKTKEKTLPITSYYFWPVSEAWEQIQFELDSKPWINKEDRLKLLNLSVEVMNLWQQSHSVASTKTNIMENGIGLPNVKIIGIP